MSESTKNKRKWFLRPKISLRTILLAMVICALLCRWVQRAETQRTLFNQMKMDERECERKYTRPRFSCRLETAPAWLQWLPESVRKFRGGHYFRNVTELNISDCHTNPEDEPDAWRRISPLLGGCKKIRFSIATLKDFHFLALKKARNLEQLDFLFVSIDPESEESFPPFVHLKRLSIEEVFYDEWDWNDDLINDQTGATQSAAVLAARFVELSKSEKLRSVSVSIWGSCIDAADVDGPAHLMIDQLAKLKKLERVHLKSRLITDEAVEALSDSPLEYLTLDSLLITDEAVEALSDLPSLRSLTLDSPLITDEAVEALSGSPSLEKLTLASPLITDEAVEALSDLPLKKLALASPLSDVAAESIAKIKSLEVVQLRNTQITDAGVRHLSTLPNLRKLDLQDCLASPAVGLSLASAKNLEEIDLHGLTVNGETRAALRKLPKLGKRSLSFSSLLSDYRDYRDYYKRKLRNLRAVAGDPKVLKTTRLDFSKSDIGDEELAALKHFSNLEYLDLSDTNVTDAGLNVLKHLPKLEELDLSYTNVTDAGLKSLLLSMADGSIDATTDLSEIPSVKLWPNLRELKLSGTKVGPLWFKFASQQSYLEKCLFADNSNIDDGCFTDLKEGSFSKLRNLNISGTSVGNKAIQTISSFPELQFLSLKSTAVGDDAIPFLLKSKCLRRLKTFGCRFTRRGIQTLTPVIYEVCTQEKGKNVLSEFGITQPAGAPWPGRSISGRTNTSLAIAELLKVKQPELVAIERTSGIVVPSTLADIYRGDWFFVIDSPKLTLEHLRPVQVQKEIRGLSLRQCDLSVDDLAELRGGYVPELELTQRFCEVPWLESFSKSGLVKVGRLRLCRKDLGIDHLKAIQTLQSPRRWVAIKKKFSSALDDLSLSGGKWKTEDMQWLAVANGFSELKRLDFADADISYDVLMGLKNHPALIEIKARNYHWRKGDCDWLLRGTVDAQGPYNFKSELVDFKEVFAALPDDARTYELSFNATNCTDEDWEALTRLKCLCTLTVFGGKLDSTSMDCLARLPFLQGLHLDNVEIDDRALGEFRRLSKLKTLSFTEMELGKLDWRGAISRCKLSKVVIDHCGLATRPRDFAPILCPETGHRTRVSDTW